MSAESNVPQNPAPPAAGPSPDLFWETVNAHQRTAALRAGIDLGLFGAIAQGADSSPVIARQCKASERGVRILCDYLTVIGFLAKSGGRYSLTPDSATFLDPASPACLAGMLRFINSPSALSAFSHLTEAVRQGHTQLEGAGYMDAEDPVWVEFARSMPPLVMGAAEFIGDWLHQHRPGPIRVLDLAAGHGLFGIQTAQRNPQAQIVAQDWANVLAVALENAQRAGIKADRYSLLRGDAFTVTFPQACDVVLVTNLYHHFDLPTCEQLARKVRAALKPGGIALTLEFVPNDDRISPPVPATFSLMMLGLTPAGDAYTFAQYDELFRAAGFPRNEILPVPRSPQHLIVSHT